MAKFKKMKMKIISVRSGQKEFTTYYIIRADIKWQRWRWRFSYNKPVSMTSKRQSTVALSASEAEYTEYAFYCFKRGSLAEATVFWFWSGANKHQTHGYQVSLCARNGWAIGCSDSLLPHWHYVSGHPDQATSWAAVWIFTIRAWCRVLT